MNAQEKWKRLYRVYRDNPLDVLGVNCRSAMHKDRREAALERALEAERRKVATQEDIIIAYEVGAQAQAERIEELERYIDQHNQRAMDRFDSALAQALNEGDGVYRP